MCSKTQWSKEVVRSESKVSLPVLALCQTFFLSWGIGGSGEYTEPPCCQHWQVLQM